MNLQVELLSHLESVHGSLEEGVVGVPAGNLGEADGERQGERGTGTGTERYRETKRDTERKIKAERQREKERGESTPFLSRTMAKSLASSLNVTPCFLVRHPPLAMILSFFVQPESSGIRYA